MQFPKIFIISVILIDNSEESLDLLYISYMWIYIQKLTL